MVSKKLIICEGDDDKGLLNRYIKEFLSFPVGSYEIRKIGNKSNLLNSVHKDYATIKQQVELGQYNRVLFVFDSDFAKNDSQSGGYENSKLKIAHLITQLNFVGIADYYICCDPITKNGNLEHLLLSAADNNKKICIEQFINCIQGMKTASNKKIVYSAYNIIFKEHPYNFDHVNFNILKQKIKWLFA